MSQAAVSFLTSHLYNFKMEHKLTIGTRDSKMNEDLDLVRLNRGPERVTGKITNANYISGITFTYPDLPGANVWHAPMEEYVHCRYNNLPVYFHEESNIYCVIDNDVVFEMQSFHRQKTRSANPSCKGCAKYGSNPKTSYKLVPGDVIACSIGCCEERRMCMDCKAPTKWGWKLDKTNVWM